MDDVGSLLLFVGGWFLLYTPAILSMLALSTMPVPVQRGLTWFLCVLSLVALLLLCAWCVQRTRHGWADFIAGEPRTWTWMTRGGWTKTLPTCSGLMTYTTFLLLGVLVVTVDMLALRWVYRLSKSVLLTILVVHVVLFITMHVVAFRRWRERVGGTLPGDPYDWAVGVQDLEYIRTDAEQEDRVVLFKANIEQQKRIVTFVFMRGLPNTEHIILGYDAEKMSLSGVAQVAQFLAQNAAVWAALFAQDGDHDHDALIMQNIEMIQQNAANRLAFSMAFLDWHTEQWCILVVGQLPKRYPVVVCYQQAMVALIDASEEQYGFMKRVLPMGDVTHMFTCGSLELRHAVTPNFAERTNMELIPLLQVLRDPWDKAIDASMETVLPSLGSSCRIVLSRQPQNENVVAAA